MKKFAFIILLVFSCNLIYANKSYAVVEPSTTEKIKETVNKIPVTAIGIALSGALLNRFTPEAMASDAAQCLSIYIVFRAAYEGVKYKCGDDIKCEILAWTVGIGVSLVPWGIIGVTAATFENNSFVTGREDEIPAWSHERSSQRKISYLNYGVYKNKNIPATYGQDDAGKTKTKCQMEEDDDPIIKSGEVKKRCLNYKELAELTGRGYTDTNDPRTLDYGKLCVFARVGTLETPKEIDKEGLSQLGSWEKSCIKPGDCKVIAGVVTCVDERFGDYLCAEGVFCSSPIFATSTLGDLGFMARPIYGRVNGGMYAGGDDNREKYNCVKVRDKIQFSWTVPPKFISKECLTDFNPASEIFGSDFAFTGRIVRCVDKTIRNIMQNKYERYALENEGDKQNEKFALDKDGYPVYLGEYCVGENGRPDYKVPADGVCEGGFLNKIQKAMTRTVAVLMIMVTLFMGLRIILFGGHPSAKELAIIALKVGFIYYFALGTAWKEGYHDFLLSSSNLIGGTIAISAEAKDSNDICDLVKKTGNTNSEGQDIVEKNYNMWDHLDCKYSKYIGFGGMTEFPTLLKFAFAGLLNIGVGILIFLCAVFFMIWLFIIALRAVFLMIASIIGIAIMIFFSPIFIPLIMFERTKSIFQGWLKQLLGFSLQPIFIFTFLNFTIIILDSFVYGNTVFDDKGNPTWSWVVDDAGNTVIDKTSCDIDSLICQLNSGLRYDFSTSELEDTAGNVSEPTSGSDVVTEGGNALYMPIKFTFLSLGISDAMIEKSFDIFYSIIKLAFVTFILALVWEKIMGIGSAIMGGANLGSVTPGAAKLVMSALGKMWDMTTGLLSRLNTQRHRAQNKGTGRDDYGLK